jgi:hypothetical protein
MHLIAIFKNINQKENELLENLIWAKNILTQIKKFDIVNNESINFKEMGAMLLGTNCEKYFVGGNSLYYSC